MKRKPITHLCQESFVESLSSLSCWRSQAESQAEGTTLATAPKVLLPVESTLSSDGLHNERSYLTSLIKPSHDFFCRFSENVTMIYWHLRHCNAGRGSRRTSPRFFAPPSIPFQKRSTFWSTRNLISWSSTPG